MQLFFNGPESFTPDNRYLLGETPEVNQLFVAAGFNSIGIQSAGAWEGPRRMDDQWRPPMDLWDVDIRRAYPFQNEKAFLAERTTEALGLLYDLHWPDRQFERAAAFSTPHFMMPSARQVPYGGTRRIRAPSLDR